MLFNSIDFLFFFPLVFLIYILSPQKIRIWILILSSSFFLIFAGFNFFLVASVIVFINYFAGIAIRKSQKYGGLIYIVTIILNILNLSFFKYYNFIIENSISIVELMGIEYQFTHLKLLLPLGISFYTFQVISYLVDIKRGTIEPEKSFLYFSVYILFFPKLIAGPIERASNFLPQLRLKYKLTFQNSYEALVLILWGLFKKIVVADRLGLMVNYVFGDIAAFNGISLIIALFYYAIQLYCDFSAYTDIAIGTSKLLGFNLMQNFNRPYLSKSISEFWRKWHISLSSWAFDYIYNPVVIRRRFWGNFGLFYALFFTFLVIGIWHGPSWNYVIFGILQSIIIFYETMTKKIRKKAAKRVPAFLYNNISILLTFSFFSFTLIFLRTSAFSEAFYIIKNLFSGFRSDLSEIISNTDKSRAHILYLGQDKMFVILTLINLGIVFIIENVFFLNINEFSKNMLFKNRSLILKWVFYFYLIFSVVLLADSRDYSFIYFQF